jgi:hypothetical protein
VIANQGSDDVSVTLGVSAPLAQEFGAGCPGTGGAVPQLVGSGGAVKVGSTTFGTQLANARVSAPYLTLFSNSQATATLGGGCEFYLAGPASSIKRFTNTSGTDTFVFGIPNNPALVGGNLYSPICASATKRCSTDGSLA